MIGQNCGIKYFRASAAFQAERNRLRRENSITSYVEQLKATLGSPQYAADVERARGRLRAVRDELGELQEKLPPGVVNRLLNMAVAKDPTVEVLFRYDDVEEDNGGNPIVTWEPEQIGTIKGLEVWYDPNVRALFSVLNDIRQTMSEARISREAGERKLKRWAEKLAELSRVVAGIEELERALESFCLPENLHLVCFTIPSHNDAIAVLRLALARAGEQQGSEGEGRHLYNRLRMQIRERRGGRDFRIR